MESARHTAGRAAHAADKNVLRPMIQQTQHTAADTKRWLQSVVSPATLLCACPTLWSAQRESWQGSPRYLQVFYQGFSITRSHCHVADCVTFSFSSL